MDDKSLAVRQPANRVLVVRIAEAFHQALRKNLGIVLFHLGAGATVVLVLALQRFADRGSVKDWLAVSKAEERNARILKALLART